MTPTDKRKAKEFYQGVLLGYSMIAYEGYIERLIIASKDVS